MWLVQFFLVEPRWHIQICRQNGAKNNVSQTVSFESLLLHNGEKISNVKESQPAYETTRHMKIKKPKVHFIIKMFLIEDECKTP